METSTQQALRSALYRLLRPLARVLLRHGMAYGSFAELVRKAFVDESHARLRLADRRPTVSAIAAMTGLTRKEVARLANSDIENDEGSDQRYNRAVRVLTAWSVDTRFLGPQGVPKSLAMDGEDSFSALVRDYSGDITPSAMLATLEAAGSVKRTERGVALLDRAYLPTRSTAVSLGILGMDVAELLTSIDHNLSSDEGRVFQRKVSNVAVSGEALQSFREYSNRKSQELLEDYDAWLGQHEIDKHPETKTEIQPGQGDAGHYVSVGIFYFDDTLGVQGHT